MQRRRLPLQLNIVFSNVLQKPNSIFFFRKWQVTYGAFQDRIKRDYDAGLQCVGDFDLAAFYDTISHELLLRTIYPRTTGGDLDWMLTCLRTWSSNRASSGHGHGLPQGPLASDLLAECFLLPIDLMMQKHRGYVRYVDDVRLLGHTENEVRSVLIELERHCRERGLIPQTGKFVIKRAKSAQDAMGMLPSISDPQHEAGSPEIEGAKAKQRLLTALGGRPYRVIDKTRLRYILYRAQPDSRVLDLVLRLIPTHPEHAEVFFTYLGRFGYRKPVERLCLSLVEENPYSYIRGEAWHVLARARGVDRSLVSRNPAPTVHRAMQVAKERVDENFTERWGACHFLCVSEQVTSTRYSRFVKFQTPMLQSLIAPVLPDAAFAGSELVPVYLRRTAIEPGLSVCPALHERGLKLSAYNIKSTQIASQVSNTLRELVSRLRNRLTKFGRSGALLARRLSESYQWDTASEGAQGRGRTPRVRSHAVSRNGSAEECRHISETGH